MSDSSSRHGMLGPIAVGGVGGSGTRVVANIMTATGFEIGSDLNEAQDNLWFNLLFFRPKWFCKGISKHRRAIRTGLGLMDKSAKGQHWLTVDELAYLVQAAMDTTLDNNFGHHSWLWALQRIRNFYRSPPIDPTQTAGWGWKEPITHLIVEDLLDYFDGARYIHVIRHGLDMAFSSNQNQTRRFGPLFNVTVQNDEPVSPTDSLRYWIRANRRTLEIMERHGPGRCMVVCFDDLCTSPEPEIRKLLAFLERDPESCDLSALTEIPRRPKSLNRYRDQSLGMFDTEDLKAVQALGFEIVT